MLHGLVGRMGHGGGECGPEAGHIPRLRSGRHLLRGKGRIMREEFIKRKQGSGPIHDEQCRSWSKRGPAATATRHSEVESRTVPFDSEHPGYWGGPSVDLPVAQSAFCPASVRPEDSHPQERSGCCAWIRSPGRQTFLGSLNHPSWDDMASESIVAYPPR